MEGSVNPADGLEGSASLAMPAAGGAASLVVPLIGQPSSGMQDSAARGGGLAAFAGPVSSVAVPERGAGQPSGGEGQSRDAQLPQGGGKGETSSDLALSCELVDDDASLTEDVKIFVDALIEQDGQDKTWEQVTISFASIHPLPERCMV
jgi:hypothetical protein